MSNSGVICVALNALKQASTSSVRALARPACRVRPKAGRIERQTILPPDLWKRRGGASIWRNPEFNTQGITIG